MTGGSTGAEKRALSKRLAALARRLAELSPEEREAVLEAASQEPAKRTASWDSIEAAVGVVNLGGDAVEDTEALYDG